MHTTRLKMPIRAIPKKTDVDVDIMDALDNLVAVASCGERADYIVHACNAHPELVRVLDNLLQFCEQQLHDYSLAHPSVVDASNIMELYKTPGESGVPRNNSRTQPKP